METKTLPDIFEPTREQIRNLQALLERRQDEFTALQHQTITDHGCMPLHGQYHQIVNLERDILSLMARIPPYAVERDGYIELRPRMPDDPPLNPRAPI